MLCLTYVHGIYKSCPLLREETMPAVSVVNTRFRLCTNLVLRPMIVVFGLGTRLFVRMRPSQLTATTECCELLLLTGVNLKL